MFKIMLLTEKNIGRWEDGLKEQLLIVFDTDRKSVVIFYMVCVHWTERGGPIVKSRES